MTKSIKTVLVAMLSAGWMALPVTGEGIASIQWLSPENIKNLPRHKISVSCTPDPKDPNSLNVRIEFKLEPGHKLYGVNFCMGGADPAEKAQGERFEGKLSIDGDVCGFKVSRKSLEKIELGYRVSENSYSMNVFGIKGMELPRLSAILDSPEAKSVIKTPKPAEQAVAPNGP